MKDYDLMIDYNTLAICEAYEQGYGHGYQNRSELRNPYPSVSTYQAEQCRMAWEYGFSVGEAKLNKLNNGLLDV